MNFSTSWAYLQSTALKCQLTSPYITSASPKYPHFITFYTQGNNRNYPLIKQTNPIPFSSFCAHLYMPIRARPPGVCACSNKLFVQSIIIPNNSNKNPLCASVLSGYKALFFNQPWQLCDEVDATETVHCVLHLFILAMIPSAAKGLILSWALCQVFSRHFLT